MVNTVAKNTCHLIATISFAVLLSACSGGGSGSGQASIATTTNFDKVEQLYREGEPSKETAISQFTAFFGPLTESPDTVYDDSMPDSSTHAIVELLKYKDELDPKTLDEIYERILPTGIFTDSLDSSEFGVQTKSTQADNELIGQVHEEMQVLANSIAVDMASRMGQATVPDVEVIRVPNRHRIGGVVREGIESVYMLGQAWRQELVSRGIELDDYGLKSSDSCWVVIATDEGDDNKFDKRSALRKERTMAHEVMHCFQDVLLASLGSAPNWVVEGAATWAGQSYVDSTIRLRSWESYENYAYYDLFYGTGYSGVGFWSHVSNSVDNLWSALPSIYGAINLDDSISLNAVIDQIGIEAYANWPKGRAQRSDWGTDWTAIGPGQRQVTTQPGSVEKYARVEFGQIANIVVPPHNRRWEGPVVLEIQASGIGGMHWVNDWGQNVVEAVEFPGATEVRHYFCVSALDCVCSDGSPIPGFENVQRAPINKPLHMAMAGLYHDEKRTWFNYSYHELSANCDDNPEELARQAELRCLAGRWYLDLDHAEQRILSFWTTEELSQTVLFSDLEGELWIEFDRDGTGIGYYNLTNTGNSDRIDYSVVTESIGNMSFEWNIDNNTMPITFLNSRGRSNTYTDHGAITYPVDESNTILTPENLVAAPSSDGPSDYTCTIGTLEFSSATGASFQYTRAY